MKNRKQTRPAIFHVADAAPPQADADQKISFAHPAPTNDIISGELFADTPFPLAHSSASRSSPGRFRSLPRTAARGALANIPDEQPIPLWNHKEDVELSTSRVDAKKTRLLFLASCMLTLACSITLLSIAIMHTNGNRVPLDEKPADKDSPHMCELIIGNDTRTFERLGNGQYIAYCFDSLYTVESIEWNEQTQSWTLINLKRWD